MSQQPAPYFVPMTGNPDKDDAIRVLNDELVQKIKEGGTDVEHYFVHLKVLLGLLASSEALRMMAMLDPAIDVAMQGLFIVGPSLEKTLGDRELLPRCKCGTCPNSELFNQDSPDLH